MADNTERGTDAAFVGLGLHSNGTLESLKLVLGQGN